MDKVYDVSVGKAAHEKMYAIQLPHDGGVLLHWHGTTSRLVDCKINGSGNIVHKHTMDKPYTPPVPGVKFANLQFPDGETPLDQQLADDAAQELERENIHR